VLVLTLLIGDAATADDAEIEILRFPMQGVAVKVDEGWRPRQGISPFLVLSKSNTTVRFEVWDDKDEAAKDAVSRLARAFQEEVGREPVVTPQPWAALCVGDAWLAWIPWDETHDGRLFGAVARDPGPSIRVTVSFGRGDGGLFDEVLRIVNCLDLGVYAHPRRYVDWLQHFTLEIAPHWRLTEPLLDPRTWGSPDGTCRVALVDLCDLAERERFIGCDSDAHAGWARLILARIGVLLHKEGLALEGKPAVSEPTVQEFVRTALLTSGLGSAEAARDGSDGARRRGALRIRTAFEAQVPNGLALVLVAKDTATQGAKEGRRIFDSWRVGTDPGPLAPVQQWSRALSTTPEPFPGEDAPDVEFLRPLRWILSEVEGEECVATIGLPCVNVRHVGTVWFHPKSRPPQWEDLVGLWRARLPGDEGKASTLDLGEGRTARIFDVRTEQVVRSGWLEALPARRLVGAMIGLSVGTLVVTLEERADVVDLQVPLLRAWLRSLRVTSDG